MRYKGKVYRPPSEAYSLIIQVTYGCSHNRCAFCDMYDDKHFALRPMEEIREDFRLARQVYRRVERVFLADGDALMRKTDELLEILAMVYSLFPECQRVTGPGLSASPCSSASGLPLTRGISSGTRNSSRCSTVLRLSCRRVERSAQPAGPHSSASQPPPAGRLPGA